MCSSFLLPFQMTGCSCQTCFVRRAASEFWLHETLTPSYIPPVSLTCMPFLWGVFTFGSAPFLCSSKDRLCGLDCRVISQQRAQHPTRGPRVLCFPSGVCLSPPLGWIELLEGIWSQLSGREIVKTIYREKNRIKSFRIWINGFSNERSTWLLFMGSFLWFSAIMGLTFLP